MLNVFTNEFVSTIRDFLKERCSNGNRVTREEVVDYLKTKNMETSPELIALAIEHGVVNTGEQAWDLFRGRYGGVREVDLEAIRAEQELRRKHAERAAKAAATRKANKKKLAQSA